MQQYGICFSSHGLAGSMLPDLTSDDLRDLGVASIGHRMSILNSVRELASQASDSVSLLSVKSQEQKSSQPASGTLIRKVKAKAVAVRVGYKIEVLEQVDCMVGRFSCNFKMFATWTDPKLAGIEPEDAVSLGIREMNDTHSNHVWEKEYPDLGLFDPELIVSNAINLKCTYHEQKVTNRVKGTVKLTKYFSGWVGFQVAKSLMLFPFDFHDLTLTLRPHKHPTTIMTIEVWDGCHASDLQNQVGEWSIVGHRVKATTTDPAVSSTGKMYSILDVTIMVDRASQWYGFNVFFFLFAIVLMSFSIFLVPLDNGSRMEVGTDLVLSIIATKFTVSEAIPRVHRATIFDEYIVACFTFVLIPVLVTAGLYHAPSRELAELLNLVAACVTAALWIAYHLYLFLRLAKHSNKKTGWKAQQLVSDALKAQQSDKSIKSMLTPTEEVRLSVNIKREATFQQRRELTQKQVHPSKSPQLK